MKPSYFLHHSLWTKRQWKTLLKLVLVLLLLSDGAWIQQQRVNPQAHAAGVSPQAVTVYGQGGSFTSGTANNGGASTTSLSHPRMSCLIVVGTSMSADYYNNRVLYYPPAAPPPPVSMGRPVALPRHRQQWQRRLAVQCQ